MLKRERRVFFAELARTPVWFRLLERGLIAEEWRHVALVNYAVSPEVLHPFIPQGLELDTIGGQTWLSLVGLVFRSGHLMRFPVHFVKSHVQIQLRMYVKRKTAEGVRPGQVVLKELGSRNAFLHPLGVHTNDYRNLQMMRSTREGKTHLRYLWKSEDKWNSFSVSGKLHPRIISPDSREGFVTQRLWDYSVMGNDCIQEMRIKHPSWRFTEASKVRLRFSTAGVFGGPFERVLKSVPSFSLIAEGSPVLLCRTAQGNG